MKQIFYTIVCLIIWSTTLFAQTAINPVDDSFVRGGVYSNDNYGANTLIDVKSSSSSEFSRSGYLRFDVSGYDGITVATLRLYVDFVQRTTQTLQVFEVPNDNWVEETLTWNIAPTMGLLINSVSIGSTGAYVEIDVTSYIQNESMGDGIASLGLKGVLSEDSRMRFNSNESSLYPPELVVTTNQPITLNPIRDSFVRGGTFSGDNYGNDSELMIKNSSNQSFSRNSYLSFDLNTPNIFNVSSATLRLHVDFLQDNTISTTVRANGVSNDTWQEGVGTLQSPTASGITWSNAPNIESQLTSVQAGPSENVWIELDVTSFINSEILGDGIATIALSGLVSEDRTIKFSSKEGSNPPELLLSTTQSPILSSPVLINANAGDSMINLNWTGVSNATGYSVHYGTISANYGSTIDVGNTLNTSITGLTNDTTYYIAIKSYNSNEESSFSNELIAVPVFSIHELIMERVRVKLLESIPTDSLVGEHLSTVQQDGSWADIDYDDKTDSNNNSWPSTSHLWRLKRMSEAYINPSSIYFGDSNIRSAIENGLNFFHDKNTRSNNWYWRTIDSPIKLTEILITMRAGFDLLPIALENKILARLKQTSIPSWSQTGANWVGVSTWKFYVALLEDDANAADEASGDAFSTLELTTGEGIQHDYSFYQHGPQFLAQHYGEALLDKVGGMAEYVAGTPYQLTGSRITAYSQFLRGSFGESFRGMFKNFSAVGREISNEGHLNKLTRALRIFESAKLVDPNYSAVYQGYIDRLNGSIAPGQGINEGHTHYYRSKFSTHNRVGYSFTVLTASDRTYRTEDGNGQNLKGRFLADGANNIRIEGDEYYDIFPFWDWNKIPGVTVPAFTSASSLEPRGTWGAPGESTFTGGVSDGEYGMTVYTQESYSTDANKAWFCFDEEIVCLGSGINSTTNTAINSTINQCNLDGNVMVSQSSSVSQLVTESNIEYINDLDWVLHDGVGYFFPQSGTIKVSNQTQSGSWNSINNKRSTDPVSGEVFKLWFPHGISPNNATYAYVIAPGLSTVQDMQNYNLGAIEILENSTEVQAVKHTSLDMIQIVFYVPKTVTYGDITIGASSPCTMILKDIGTSQVTLSIADPGENSSQIDVTWNSPSFAQSQTIFCSLPTGVPFAGQSVDYSINNGSSNFRATVDLFYDTEKDAVESVEDKLIIHPSPVSDFLTLSLPSAEKDNSEFRVAIFDLNGRLLKEEGFRSIMEIMVTVEQLDKGLYILQLDSKEKRYQQKFIKQ